MRDLNKEIKKALENNQELVSLLSGKRIGHLIFNGDKNNPYITFSEVNNQDGDFADDRVYNSDLLYQIDIWSKKPITIQYKKEVDRVMKSIGFSRFSTADLYEDDTKIYHYGMRYRTKISLIEEE
ncbi:MULTISPECIES: DUF3168 domain-containing protein [Bacillus cereus group]|uniref:DUF3168 domain-containing protein n=1 Tax=Bacillus cereus group TaxID=86661 RepID=UPI001F56EB55|nr:MULTISPECIES: DUF3168 domain-containing protein [unclassified Bacillus cereus group]EMA6341685.1 hypothetical protein [Bacillus cytotoxicus]